ncbi:MAG: DEAD/DEAH box helicase [Cellulosilyticaceae bacterium]
MTNTFENLKLNTALIEGLKKQNITVPMTIQTLVLPVALENKDVIAQSHTGSGKTLSFLLPLFTKIDATQKQTQAIILAPTHELVVQINEQIKLLATNSGFPITSTPIMGGVNIEKQIQKLKTKPHIIVGSSGRILDLIKKKKINSQAIRTIVIDEADNLLDKNQSQTIKDIVKTTLRDTQIMLFSATIHDITLKEANSFTKDPVILNACEETKLNPHISHGYIVTEQRKKFETLRKLLNANAPTKALIFVNNIHEVEIIVEKLLHHQKNAGGLYGTQTKEQRAQTLQNFRSGKIDVLVSSDLSARGLDIPCVSHVFNLDLPPSSNDYLHRAGRTARGNDTGVALSILTPSEQKTVREYEKSLGITLENLTK